MVDKHIKEFISKKINNETPTMNKTKIEVFYKNQMNGNYKLEERILKNIVYKNVKCNDSENEQLKIIFYYKNSKTANLVIKNSPTTQCEDLNTTNVIYNFTCNRMTCQSANYIGMTRTTLKKRLDSHYYNGSIYKHYKEFHKEKLTKENLYNNTKIIEKEQEWKRLSIKEALKIIEMTPKLNIQYESFNSILQLYKNGNINASKRINSNNNAINIINIENSDIEASLLLESNLIQSSPLSTTQAATSEEG